MLIDVVEEKKLKGSARKVVSLFCQKLKNLEGWEEIRLTLIFVYLERIKKLNKQFRNINAPTDVLSFESTVGENMPSKHDLSGREEKKSVGDVYVCTEVVTANAKRFKRDFKEELIRVIVHGMLHLVGYDHEESFTGEKREEMFRVQEGIVRKIQNCN